MQILVIFVVNDLGKCKCSLRQNQHIGLLRLQKQKQTKKPQKQQLKPFDLGVIDSITDIFLIEMHWIRQYLVNIVLLGLKDL